jgi:hypothetical protein
VVNQGVHNKYYSSLYVLPLIYYMLHRHVQYKRLGEGAQLGRLTRQQAAVAADLVLTWRVALGDTLAGRVC